MNTLNREQCEIAIAEWTNCCRNFEMIKNLIPTNYVFNFDADEVDWMKKLNKNSDFCTQIGIYENKMVAILYPMDVDGRKIYADNYAYSTLNELDRDLRLVETEAYTVVKNAVLSKDLRKVDGNSDMYFPVSGKPMMDQDKAVAAIESWRNDGISWFFRECDEFGGNRIFKRFYVPSNDLIPSKPGLTNIVCSFGLKFSDVYQRILPTLIFISFYQDLQNTGSIERISNTYDWSEPCPPICKYM
ncbi:hypothetical protein SD427_15165 [Chryseobacterium sp. JJR-5R]|uniref:hypothetical protein n=1 Tax=Chryseobacterium sp. JJR-5R TaxID=3093923 RepID=UPI002A74B7D9|nr:hypothetical protein [Chryseobacterium sp. JJR-5R]WPO82096.1 hypothetical protein SD427_15165 [Chryseobacterium sp. JJR-5R]